MDHDYLRWLQEETERTHTPQVREKEKVREKEIDYFSLVKNIFILTADSKNSDIEAILSLLITSSKIPLKYLVKRFKANKEFLEIFDNAIAQYFDNTFSKYSDTKKDPIYETAVLQLRQLYYYLLRQLPRDSDDDAEDDGDVDSEDDGDVDSDYVAALAGRHRPRPSASRDPRRAAEAQEFQRPRGLRDKLNRVF